MLENSKVKKPHIPEANEEIPSRKGVFASLSEESG
jgi:hypothetical protein